MYNLIRNIILLEKKKTFSLPDTHKINIIFFNLFLMTQIRYKITRLLGEM